MPSYFYQICFEPLLDVPSNRCHSSDASSLTIESICESLRPFKKQHNSGEQNQNGKLSPANIKQGFRTSELNPTKDSSNILTASFRQCRAAESSLLSQQVQHEGAARYPRTPHSATSSAQLTNDRRVDNITVEGIDMVLDNADIQLPVRRSCGSDNNQIAKGIGSRAIGGLATKGKYISLDHKVPGSVCGIVHLYRDGDPTPGLSDNDDDPYFLKGSSIARNARVPSSKDSKRPGSTVGSEGSDIPVAPEDCTILCILAVPSYMSPSDFLGWVGQETKDEVSHFRMIRTERRNRYMVLMKFRNGRKAREWQKEWNGKVFNSTEPETCHVVFVKDVEIQVPVTSPDGKFPDANNDPFIPQAQASSVATASLSAKPLAPPTPSLVELPTCPVCLERMDETNGLLTIICQHVFHCTCLQKWKGSGCPVCRYTQEDLGKRTSNFSLEEEPAECSVCRSEENLWICLVCGNIGCGRYDGAHAFAHFKETAHSFAMDLSSQRVWDYVGDGYVHRIIQNKADGKLLELPAADNSALDPPDWGDAVPREKWENMSLEYTHLLTSQLESQRTYFEEKVERAADKASEAAAAAVAAQDAGEKLTKRLEALQSEHDNLLKETIPALEKDKGRAERRAEKFESLAHKMEKEYQEEKTINTSLMERVEYLTAEVEKLKAANEDLAEQNRDLTFFISGSEKLKDQGDDVVEGTVSVPEPSKTGKKKKGKGKK
ncbi:C3HC4-type (RING finger)-containing protein [Emydomyces testavorans]|uniref:C3HC4-type (RING finger)-containing protein n=1 Tax=Emydomyces testavorans TaxID=2070801 RepID=A0AAF0DHJ7_9EURO|nr:C3HC4-type (RING finger)-containing protein [Emydomyces testavorans]